MFRKSSRLLNSMQVVKCSRGLLCVVMALIVPSMGCGWVVGEIAEQASIESDMETYRYDVPVEQLWNETVTALVEEGFRCPPKPVVGATSRCDGEQDKTERSWTNVRITELDGRYRLELDEISERRKDGEWVVDDTSDASETEWKILQRIDPKFASKVQKKAQERKREASQAGRKVLRALLEAEEATTPSESP